MNKPNGKAVEQVFKHDVMVNCLVVLPLFTLRKQLEHAKKEAEQKARKEAAEKEELQALLKEREEEMEAELAARDEAVSPLASINSSDFPVKTK